MERLGIALLCSAFLAATPVAAQVTDVTGEASSVITLDPNVHEAFAGSGTRSDPSAKGASYASSVAIDTNRVSFEAGNAVSGPTPSIAGPPTGRGATASSHTSVDITFTNNTGRAVTPRLVSDIIPAGFGFYLADRSSGCGGNIYAGCPQSASGLTFANLPPTVGATAQTDFKFTILSDGVPVYRLSGALALAFATGTANLVVNQTIGDAAAVLNGFTRVTPLGSASALGYAWDNTGLVLDLPTPLASGASRTLTYQTEVDTSIDNACIDAVTCLVAYSGFGDPVGRGGGIASVSAIRFAAISSGIPDVTFRPAVFNIPTFKDGVLFFETAPVPEPTTWAFLIFGFGVIGAALRRRRAVSFA